MTLPTTQPIHVLQLVQGLEIGGLEKIVLSLITHLDPSLVRVSVCCFDYLGPLATEANTKGIEVCLLKRKPGIDWSYPWRLCRFLKDRNIQVLHLHNPTAFFYGTLAGKLARTPYIVYTEHGRDFSEGWKIRLAHRWLAKMVDRIVVVAKHGQRVLVREEGVDERKITLIYNGIDGKRFNRVQYADYYESIRTGLGLTSHTQVIGVVGRLDAIKNHAVLFEAMHILLHRFPKVSLLVIGEGPLRVELETMIEQMDLKNHVKFLGARADVPELLTVLDGFVLPSFSEGLSLTLIEACAAGVPIVATRVGGNEEVVVDQENGLLVPSDDAEALGKAISSILSNTEMARKMGANGRKRFEAHFTLGNMVQKYHELYASCMTPT